MIIIHMKQDQSHFSKNPIIEKPTLEEHEITKLVNELHDLQRQGEIKQLGALSASYGVSESDIQDIFKDISIPRRVGESIKMSDISTDEYQGKNP